MIYPDQSAFPVVRDGEELSQPGLSIRVYLAAKAMQGLLAQHETEECESGNRDLGPCYTSGRHEMLAKHSVKIADELIAALNAEKPTG